MKEIGGYFELELNYHGEYHLDAIRLNLGRSAFEYILKAKRIKKVFLPYYTCDVMLTPLERLGVDYEFYHIDENLEPIFNYSSTDVTGFFVYTNYFGLKGKFVKQLAGTVSNLIIDNSQAFFDEPLFHIDTFYSPRKFFGVPDGAYLYTDTLLNETLDTDYSADRFKHLLGRIDKSAEISYNDFKQNELMLSEMRMREMSTLTKRILASIDYSEAARKRRENFIFLHEHLNQHNLFNLEISDASVPMVYPYLTEDPGLRSRLIMNKIFVAMYWPGVLNCVSEDSLEHNLVNKLIPLPVDQRYKNEDLVRIIKSI